MDPVKALVLGLIQGLTEFLPVSSSGHLVLAQHLLGLKQALLLFDIVVHLGTLAAVIVFVHREIGQIIRAGLRVPWLSWRGLARSWREEIYFRLLVLIALGAVSTGLIGLIFKDPLTSLFASPTVVGWALIATGCFLAATRFVPPGRLDLGRLTPGRALILGAVQGAAIIPGISRSGATISAGLFLGLEREAAARFSFLLFLPAIIGALALELSGSTGPGPGLSAVFIGFGAAAVSGYLALMLLMRLLAAGRFHLFAPYCFGVGLLTLLAIG